MVALASKAHHHPTGDGNLEPGSHELAALAVRATPFASQAFGQLLCGSRRLRGSHPVRGEDQRRRVSTALQAGLEILSLFGLLLVGQDLARRRTEVGLRISISDADVKDGSVATAPEAVGTDIPSVVGAVHREAVLVECRLCPSVFRPPDTNKRFGEYGSWGEGLLTEAGPFVTDVVVAKVDQSSLLALKGIVRTEAFVTPITVSREVERGGGAEAESQVILKLILAEFRPAHVTRVHRQVGAILLAPRDGLLDQEVNLGRQEVEGGFGGNVALQSGRSGDLNGPGGVLLGIEPDSLSEGVGDRELERL
jgi:hypothetical protein